MKAIHVQRTLALIFLGLGGWCLFFPSMVEQLGLRPEHIIGNRISALFIGCFGAQAMLCGTLMWTSRFLPSTFLIFGIVGSLPFFGFNYYFYFVERIFTDWMLLDFAGNIGILVTCMLGWRLATREQAQREVA